MATIATFSVRAADFPLGSITVTHPEVTVELERIVPTAASIVPYFWVRGLTGADCSDIQRSFEGHEDVAEVVLVDEIEGNCLFRAEWEPHYQGILHGIESTHVALLSGSGSGDRWTFEVRADDHADIIDFQRYCRDYDIVLTVTSVQTLSDVQSETEYELTEPQRKTLVLAHERGYYHSPREATLADLAAELGITRQSVGSRLRRGTHNLVGSTLVAGRHPGE